MKTPWNLTKNLAGSGAEADIYVSNVSLTLWQLWPPHIWWSAQKFEQCLRIQKATIGNIQTWKRITNGATPAKINRDRNLFSYAIHLWSHSRIHRPLAHRFAHPVIQEMIKIWTVWQICSWSRVHTPGKRDLCLSLQVVVSMHFVNLEVGIRAPLSFPRYFVSWGMLCPF